LAAAPSSDANDPDETDSTATGICTPSARSASSISRPMGQKAAKKRRIDQYKEDEVLSETSNFIAASKDRLASLNEGNEIMKASNAISSERVKIEEKKLELEEKKQVVEEEHRQSETQINDLKILAESEDIEDQATLEVLLLIKERIKNKWRGRA
jgi:type IV secretory pathway protease TraF